MVTENFRVTKNFGRLKQDFSDFNEMMAYVINNNKNNLVKSLNQVDIKRKLNLTNYYQKGVGKLLIMITKSVVEVPEISKSTKLSKTKSERVN